MITCCLTYVIDPYKTAEFEAYARRWIPLVRRHGGAHHGYFLPSEGASNVALALFSFPSLARYEDYRVASAADPDCIAAREFARQTRCFSSYQRTFFRPTGTLDA
jgi:hypothetical protein